MFDLIWPAIAGWLTAHAHQLGLAALALGIAHRERGQGHSWLGTTGARVLFWAMPVACTVYLLLAGLALDAHAALLAAACGAAAFAGMAGIPHGAGQNLRVPWSVDAHTAWPADDSLFGITRPERLGYLLAASIVRLWLISLPLVATHPAALWLPIGGVFMPIGYLIGTRMPLLGWRLTRATEWGEFLTGAGFGAAIATVLLI
ncbi:hypothetical protein TSH100_04215 [Azospirillum sp. TSH100]|uniref:hypothetical protein n=1 Tax=Azospirillum sp. TSH100 TaxID=652764 RepID=UPI000D617305|nr:hypothetical protein [Azospirillum sp. TSH100]PWC89848.1 hypothetical protein TSH100_04215 [Azospirillum sp. TSH100]QCG92327.1 hypothetical protein E6C72_31470 [Azospirillum sp. TSH100]